MSQYTWYHTLLCFTSKISTKRLSTRSSRRRISSQIAVRYGTTLESFTRNATRRVRPSLPTTESLRLIPSIVRPRSRWISLIARIHYFQNPRISKCSTQFSMCPTLCKSFVNSSKRSSQIRSNLTLYKKVSSQIYKRWTSRCYKTFNSRSSQIRSTISRSRCKPTRYRLIIPQDLSSSTSRVPTWAIFRFYNNAAKLLSLKTRPSPHRCR